MSRFGIKQKFKVQVINLRRRLDRRLHIQKQFAGKSEFAVEIVPAEENGVGAIGLWMTICSIVEAAISSNDDFILICEDDHLFTNDYSAQRLISAMNKAVKFDAEILLGGISWFTNCCPIDNELYWVEKFSGLQFTIIFKNLYERILNADFGEGDAADYKISTLTDKIFFVSPFISIQKEFGYSDVTATNVETGKVSALFDDALCRVNATNQVIAFYRDRKAAISKSCYDRNIQISTYVIISAIDRRGQQNIIEQFEGKSEFDVQFIEPSIHKKENLVYWLSIRAIVIRAKENNEDVIVICEDDHQFTAEYSRDGFIHDIINLYQLGAKLICGGVDDFDMAISIEKGKIWIGTFTASPFLIMYKDIYDKVLTLEFDETSMTEDLFRELTSNKMVLFPYISKRRHLEDSNVEEIYASNKTSISRMQKIHDVARLSGLI